MAPVFTETFPVFTVNVCVRRTVPSVSRYIFTARCVCSRCPTTSVSRNIFTPTLHRSPAIGVRVRVQSVLSAVLGVLTCVWVGARPRDGRQAGL
eukprot:1777003-Prymnesium_polylepis.1